MTLDVRDFTMAGQFAKGAQTVIPAIPISGQAYRNPSTSKAQIELGQAYNQIGPSAFWNQILYLATGIAGLSEKFGFVPWSAFTDYAGDASWCLGQDGTPYRAVADSGPGDAVRPGVGAKPPPDEAYWETMAEYIGRMGGEAGGGGGGGDTVYPSAFADFHEQSPPVGWMVRNGGLVGNARTVVPDLYAALQEPENSWKLKTEAEWQALSAASPFTGIGGAPFFVLNASANTIRLPDTRGMYKEDAGFDGLTVGGAHGDAARKLAGTVPIVSAYGHNLGNGTGALFATQVTHGSYDAYTYGTQINLDSSRTLPTASVFRPKAFGVLGCVYVGKIGS